MLQLQGARCILGKVLWMGEYVSTQTLVMLYVSAQLEISRDHAPSAVFLVIHEHEQYINWFSRICSFYTPLSMIRNGLSEIRCPATNDACKEPWQALLSPTEATESLRQGSRSSLLLSAANRKI